MPRLLLVDDNPSIHRIAESLLAPTDVELVCVASAAEALDFIARGERFDVALVDTAMPGMDGWTLLTRLRSMDETARMPIALMAGVLDPVDPAKLAKAPIQGFLKKPIELRELGDRVKALLATPVTVSPSPYSTVPATPASELVKRAEPSLPELRPEPEPEHVEIPTGLLDAELNLPEPDEDLLVLDAEDLWPEEAVVLPEPVAPAVPDVHLELEELDLDSLQDLAAEPMDELTPAAAILPEPARASEPTFTPKPAFAFDPANILPEEEEDHLVTLSGLEDLDNLPAGFQIPQAAAALAPVQEPVPPPAAHDFAEDAFAHLPVAASLIGGAGLAAGAGLVARDASPAAKAFAALTAHEPPAAAPAAGGQVPALPGQAAASVSGPASISADQARDLVQALLADPVLVDALVKAVAARMGDQVLREIAWEVMPDLAGRLQR